MVIQWRWNVTLGTERAKETFKFWMMEQTATDQRLNSKFGQFHGVFVYNYPEVRCGEMVKSQTGDFLLSSPSKSVDFKCFKNREETENSMKRRARFAENRKRNSNSDNSPSVGRACWAETVRRVSRVAFSTENVFVGTFRTFLDQMWTIENCEFLSYTRSRRHNNCSILQHAQPHRQVAEKRVTSGKCIAALLLFLSADITLNSALSVLLLSINYYLYNFSVGLCRP